MMMQAQLIAREERLALDAEAKVRAVETELKSLAEARYTRPGREGEWTRHIIRCVRKAMKEAKTGKKLPEKGP